MAAAAVRQPVRHQATKQPSPLDGAADAPSAFASFLALPYTVLSSPKLHVVALRLLLASLLALAAVGLSSTSYFVLYFTWGRVPSFSAPLGLTYGSPGHPPHATVVLPANHWRPNQPYDVVVELDCPLSADNVALGNFMVHVDVFPVGAKTALASASQATLLTPPPALSPKHVLPLVWGVPSRTLRLPLLEGVVLADSRKAKVADRITVWVGREDGWGVGSAGDGGREVVTTGARLVIRGRLSGLRSLLNKHPLLSLTTLTSVSLLTTLLASLLSFYLFSPSLPASLSRPAVLAAPPSPTGAAKLRSSRREREWAASLPRAMDDVTGDDADDQAAETDESTASSLLAEEEAREEQDLVRLRAKEAELRRVKAELEAAEEKAADEREAEQRRVRVAAAAAQEAALNATTPSKGDDDEDDGRSLLGGSGTTPSHRSFGATTARSSSTATTASSRSTRP